MDDDRRRYYKAKIRHHVRQVLEGKEHTFRAEHSGDTDKELLQYVRQCARVLRHSPNRIEVIGGKYIEERFGNWECVLLLANLPAADKPPPFDEMLIVRREWQGQVKVIRQENRAKREAKAAEAANE